MAWSRRICTPAAITNCFLLVFNSGAVFSQDPQGATRSIDPPWVINCEIRTCISTEQAADAFFKSVTLMNANTPPGEMPWMAFGLNEASWDALVAHARALAKDDHSYQLELKRDLCSQTSTITTQAQLAAALDENDRLAEQHLMIYVDNLDTILTPAELDSVTQEIDYRRDHMGWADFDWAMYFEKENIDPASFLARICEG